MALSCTMRGVGISPMRGLSLTFAYMDSNGIIPLTLAEAHWRPCMKMSGGAAIRRKRRVAGRLGRPGKDWMSAGINGDVRRDYQ